MINYVPLADQAPEALLELWNRELGEQFPMTGRLLQQSLIQDANLLREGSWAAWDEQVGRLVGFVAAKCWMDREEGVSFAPEAGWISALLVDTGSRGQGIGSELLRLGEKGLREHGVASVDLGNDMHRRIFPGVPGSASGAAAWFERRGYAATGTLQDLLCRYEPEEAVFMPSPEGVVIRIAGESDRDSLISFLEAHFPGRWHYSTRQYWPLGGTGREFVLMEQAGRIIGFCRINDSHSPVLAQNIYWSERFDDELGGVGPLGVDSAFRGQGLGAAMVLAGIAALRQRGIRNIIIDSTPIAAFYEKLGYSVWQTYTLYRKQLQPG